jgi:hypothetical protein
MGQKDLIGDGKEHLIPTWQPKGTGNKKNHSSDYHHRIKSKIHKKRPQYNS